MRAKEFITEGPSRFQPHQRYTLDNERLEQLRQDPRVKVMLDLISRAEGNTNYDTIVGQPLPGGKLKPGGKSITDFSKHPEYVGLRTKHGPSDAAGRYQILSSTYRKQVEQLAKNGVQIKDFSPESQDKIAIAILNAVGAIDPILKGNYKQAVKLSNNQWVSLPGTKFSQGFGPRKDKWVDSNVAELKKSYGLDTPNNTQIAKVDTQKPEPKKPETTILDKIKTKAGEIIGTTLSPKTGTAQEVPKPKAASEPSLVQKYIDANRPQPVKPEQQPVTKKSEVKVDSPEYEKMMWDKQVAAGDKFSREREARLEKERIAKSKGLPIEPPITEPDLDPKGWAEYDAYMNKLQTEKGDKFSQEYQAAEKKSQSTPKDDSYYTKFMNLFK
jgi:muramidase (phage lysozyme)